MPYTADISRINPGCFLFLIDQSGSMSMALGGNPGELKMDQAAATLNRTLDAISQRCSQGLDVRDYFHIGVIGYRTDAGANSVVRSLLAGTTNENPFLPISEVVEIAQVEERVIKESDGAGGLVEVTRKMPVWLYPEAEYGTPMCEALDVGAMALANWVAEHPNSYPPIVINISDGMATDGEPEEFAWRIMALETSDGNALVFNANLSDTTARPIQFPDSEALLPDDEAVTLFRMSSVLPEPSRSLAAAMGIEATDQARGFVFNANLEALAQFLDIGTRGPGELH